VIDLEIDVSDVAGAAGLAGPAGPAVLRGWLREPTAAWPGARSPLVYCLPGGYCSTGYFDLRVDGLPGWSMADHLAARGAFVASLDHLGIGASSRVGDLFAVTPRLLAALHARAVEAVRAIVGHDVVAVGLGHSMGGMIATVQQARHRSFDALVVLGHGGEGLPRFVPDIPASTWTGKGAGPPAGDEVHGRLAELARTRAANPPAAPRKLPPNSFFLPDVPSDVRRAFVAQQADLLPSCGLASLIPGSTDADKAAVDVPVFLGFGDHDLTGDYVGSLARYRAARDATLYVLPGSAHCQNQAATATRLWDRIAAWMSSVAGVLTAV
jgi:alpha-beta hydrolase superfamily lysophospholipase